MEFDIREIEMVMLNGGVSPSLLVSILEFFLSMYGEQFMVKGTALGEWM